MLREEATGEHREVSLSLRSSLGPGDEDRDNKGDNNGLFVGKRKSSDAILIGGDFLLLAMVSFCIMMFLDCCVEMSCNKVEISKTATKSKGRKLSAAQRSEAN